MTKPRRKKIYLGFYSDRTAGGHCDHCHFGRAIAASLSKAKQKAYQTHCISNLKQFAYAINMYTQDNRDFLPGPAWTGIFFTYVDTNPSQQSGDWRFPDKYEGSLVAQLTSYLAIPPPSPSPLVRTAAVTICPASYRVLPAVKPTPPLYVPISYFSQSFVTNEPGPPLDGVQYPFGRADGTAFPKKVTAIKRPSDSWVMTDCDLQYVNGIGISSATYLDYIAKEPVHGAKKPALRNYMFFDWSVRSQKNPLLIPLGDQGLSSALFPPPSRSGVDWPPTMAQLVYLRKWRGSQPTETSSRWEFARFW
jgi:hypothetical protein